MQGGKRHNVWVVNEKKMRGKNKCIILKGGIVEVGLDAAT